MAYPYSGIPLNNKKESATDKCYNVDKSQKHTKWKKQDIHTHKYCIILFIWNVQKRKIYSNRQQIRGCLGRGVGTGIDSKWVWGFLLRDWKYFKIRLWCWLNNSVNLLTLIEFYTYNSRILRYVNYTPIKLF